MKKQIFLGTNEFNEDVFVTIELSNGELSISGVIGPKSNGNASGGCGQIDPVSIVNYASEWNKRRIDELNDIWERWHLNSMNAGNKEQEYAIREWKASDIYDKKYYNQGYDSWYSMCCAYLESIDMLVVDGYRYGTAWIFEPLDPFVEYWFATLPATTKLAPRAWRD
jgi:hypothetical protein